MSIRRITISVPSEIATRVKKAAGDAPVSVWVTRLIEDWLDDAELEKLWEDFYRSVRPRSAEVQRANAIFRKLTRQGRRKRAA